MQPNKENHMTLSIVVAIASNGAIGKSNDLLWHLPGDLKRFKEITSGHTVIMGRNTFYSLPKGPLPNRRNIIVSSTMQPVEGVEVFSTIEAALQAVENDGEVFVIGGAQLYKSLLPYCHKLYLTRVEKAYHDADTFFPDFDLTEWRQIKEQRFPADDKNIYSCTLNIYQRIPYFLPTL